MATKIAVKNLFKIFGKRPRDALQLLSHGYAKEDIFSKTGQSIGVQDATFEILDGEIFVLMGLSGSGKSTLIRMFNRLIEPTSGSVLVDGEEVTRMSQKSLIELRRRKMAMVFQSFALLPNRTVYENASFGLEVTGLPREQRKERTMQALDSVGLRANADSLPSELSGGMQQRVGLARALATDPQILLMDEAFSALDPLIRAEMQDQLLALQKQRARTIVFVSHDLDEALKIGDRICIMEHGRIAQVDTPAEILRKPENDYVRAFFRGVDVSQVFTVGQFTERLEGIEIEGADSAAQAARDQLNKAGHRLGAVLGEGRRVAGVVTFQSLEDALARNEYARCADAFVPAITPVSADASLVTILEPLAATAEALPVVDEVGAYRGVITKSAMLHALNRHAGENVTP